MTNRSGAKSEACFNNDIATDWFDLHRFTSNQERQVQLQRKVKPGPIARMAVPMVVFGLVVDLFAATSAGAQVATPSSLVSVCSGVTLPRSVVTSIVSPVLTGIYGVRSRLTSTGF